MVLDFNGGAANSPFGQFHPEEWARRVSGDTDRSNPDSPMSSKFPLPAGRESTLLQTLDVRGIGKRNRLARKEGEWSSVSTVSSGASLYEDALEAPDSAPSHDDTVMDFSRRSSTPVERIVRSDSAESAFEATHQYPTLTNNPHQRTASLQASLASFGSSPPNSPDNTPRKGDIDPQQTRRQSFRPSYSSYTTNPNRDSAGPWRMKPLVLNPSRTAAIPLTATSSTLERRISARSASPLQSPPAAASPHHLYRSTSSIRTYSSPPPTQAKRRSLGYVSESKRSSNNSSASSSYVVNLAREYSRSSNVTAESPDSSVVEFEGDGTTQWGSDKLGSDYSHREDERLETAFETENEMELEREIRSVVRVRQVSITPRILDYSHPRDDSSETIGSVSASPFSADPTFATCPPTIALFQPSPVRSDDSPQSTRSNQPPSRPPFDRPRPNSATLSPGTTSAATLDSPLSVSSEPPSPPPSFPLPRLPPNTRPHSNRSSVDSHQKTSSIISTTSSQSSQEDFRLSTYSVDQFLDPDGNLSADSTSRRRARSSLVSIAPSIRRLDSWSGGLESAGVVGAGVGTEHFNQHWHEDLLSTLDDVVPHPPSSTASILADYTFGSSSRSIPATASLAQKPLPTFSATVSPSSSSKELAATPTTAGERVARPRKLSPTSLNTIRNSLFSSSPNLLRTAPSSPSVEEVDGFIREPRQREGSFVSLSPTKSRTLPLPRVGSISGAAGSPAKPSASWPPPDEPTRTITAGKQLVSMEQQSPSQTTLKRGDSTTSSMSPSHYLAQSTRREPRDPRGKIDQDDMSLRDFFNTTIPTPVSPPRSISPLTTRSSYSNYSVESVTPASSKTRFGSKLFSGFAKSGGEPPKNGLSRQTSLSSITDRFNLRRATNLNSFGTESKSPRLGLDDSDDVLEIIVPLGSPSTPPFVRIMSPRSPQFLSPSLSSSSISSLAPKVLPISSIFPVRKSTVFPSRLTGSSVEADRI